MRLRNKVCIVTGGSRGIGKGIASFFAKEGAKVVIDYLSEAGAARETAAEIVDRYHADVEVVKADVSKEDEVVELLDNARKTFGTVDILVNNAGVHKDSVLWKMDKNTWDEVMSTNLTGIFLCMKHVIPIMREKGWGRIVNVSSVVGQTGLFGASNYSASKAGIFGLTKTAAKEVANMNITVNCIAFGYINAGMNLRLHEKFRQKILQEIPMKRFGEVEEVAGPIVFLCTDEAAYITGQIIHINGGYYM